MKKLLSLLTITTISLANTTNIISCHFNNDKRKNTDNDDLLFFSQIKSKIEKEWQDWINNIDNSFKKMNNNNEFSLLEKLHSLVSENNKQVEINYEKYSDVFEYIFDYFKNYISKINDSILTEYSNYYNNDLPINFYNPKENIREILVNYINNNDAKQVYLNIKITVDIKFKKLSEPLLLNGLVVLSNKKQTPQQEEANKQALDVINNYLEDKIFLGLPSMPESAPKAVKWFWNKIILPVSKNINLVNFSNDQEIASLMDHTKNVFNHQSISKILQKNIINMANNSGLKLLINKNVDFYQETFGIINNNLLGVFNWILHEINYLKDNENLRDVLIDEFKQLKIMFLDYSYFSVSSFLLQDNTPVIGSLKNVTHFFSIVYSNFWDSIYNKKEINK